MKVVKPICVVAVPRMMREAVAVINMTALFRWAVLQAV